MPLCTADERTAAPLAEDPRLRTWLLGPDAVLTAPSGGRYAEPYIEASLHWLLELEGPDEDPIRVRIAGGYGE
jgi:hypothetical protein